jgi:hypothetical protein
MSNDQHCTTWRHSSQVGTATGTACGHLYRSAWRATQASCHQWPQPDTTAGATHVINTRAPHMDRPSCANRHSWGRARKPQRMSKRCWEVGVSGSLEHVTRQAGQLQFADSSGVGHAHHTHTPAAQHCLFGGRCLPMPVGRGHNLDAETADPVPCTDNPMIQRAAAALAAALHSRRQMGLPVSLWMGHCTLHPPPPSLQPTPHCVTVAQHPPLPLQPIRTHRPHALKTPSTLSCIQEPRDSPAETAEWWSTQTQARLSPSCHTVAGTGRAPQALHCSTQP